MDDFKQYVNLDPAKPDELKGLDSRRAGHKVKVVATINPKKKGVRVIFAITNGANNMKDAKKTLTRQVMTDKGGRATLDLTLSKFGGDEFIVHAYLWQRKPAQWNRFLSHRYTVWRRIYYQMSRFDSVAKGANRDGVPLPAVSSFNLGPVKTELEARHHCIEMVDENGRTDTITRCANVLTSQNNSRDYKRSARVSYDAKREPVAMRIVLVHQIAESKTAEVTIPINNDTNLKVWRKSQKVPHRLWVDESVAEHQDWLINAHWKGKKEDDTWQDLAPACLNKVAENEISIVLSNVTMSNQQSPRPGEYILVRVKYRYLAGSTCGSSWYNAIWLASSYMGHDGPSEKEKQAIAIHEIGHWLGMVPWRQKTHYTGRGHQGPHCSTGLSETDQRKRSYSGLPGTCVMFGENASSMQGKFCDRCSPSVRKSKVRGARMPRDWK